MWLCGLVAVGIGGWIEGRRRMRSILLQRCSGSRGSAEAGGHGSRGSGSRGAGLDFLLPRKKRPRVTKPGSRFFPWEQVAGGSGGLKNHLVQLPASVQGPTVWFPHQAGAPTKESDMPLYAAIDLHSCRRCGLWSSQVKPRQTTDLVGLAASQYPCASVMGISGCSPWPRHSGVRPHSPSETTS